MYHGRCTAGLYGGVPRTVCGGVRQCTDVGVHSVRRCTAVYSGCTARTVYGRCTDGVRQADASQTVSAPVSIYYSFCSSPGLRLVFDGQ